MILAALGLRLPPGRPLFSPATLLRWHSRRILYADRVLRSEGARVALPPYRRPKANAHCERVIKTIRHEALDWLLISGERHLRLVLRQYIDHYNRQLPHLALDLRLPHPAAVSEGSGPILRRQRLNGDQRVPPRRLIGRVVSSPHRRHLTLPITG